MTSLKLSDLIEIESRLVVCQGPGGRGGWAVTDSVSRVSFLDNENVLGSVLTVALHCGYSQTPLNSTLCNGENLNLC